MQIPSSFVFLWKNAVLPKKLIKEETQMKKLMAMLLVLMLALSMVVIAGMVGAGGLGGEVVASLNRINAGLGFEAGLAVVILAMYLDRLTSMQSKSKLR